MYLLIALLAAAFTAAAQETPNVAPATHDMSQMGRDMSNMPGMNHETPTAMDASGTSRNPASVPNTPIRLSSSSCHPVAQPPLRPLAPNPHAVASISTMAASGRSCLA